MEILNLQKETTHRSKFQVMLLLDCVFGFLTYIRVALSNIFITLELHRNFLSKMLDMVYSLVTPELIIIIELD